MDLRGHVQEVLCYNLHINAVCVLFFMTLQFLLSSPSPVSLTW